MDAETVSEIDRRLSHICEVERVSIPWAIESGSRAWGFPSPDSDYDCRFLYTRSLRDSLSLFPGRDVIEQPITAIFDVGGWELGKALKLLLKGNAVIIEWLTSPIVYDGNKEFQQEFLELADVVVNRKLIANHYLRLAISMREKTLKGSTEVPLKKLFYIIRPLMALDWLDSHPCKQYAPMHFPSLLQEQETQPALQEDINNLLEKKKITKELGSGTIPRSLQTYIKSAFERHETRTLPKDTIRPEDKQLADEFHYKWIVKTHPE